jgi:hypothetical protein
MSYSAAEIASIFVQVIIVLVIVRRSYRMTQGVPYSLARLVALPTLILALWMLDEVQSLLLTPWAFPYLIGLDSGVLAGTALIFTPVARRMTTVTRDPAGFGSIRIEFSLAAVFVIAFAVRLLLALVLFPSALEFGSPTGGYPPSSEQAVLAVIDALFSFSAGLVVARSLGIHRQWNSASVGVS